MLPATEVNAHLLDREFFCPWAGLVVGEMRIESHDFADGLPDDTGRLPCLCGSGRGTAKPDFAGKTRRIRS
jgi:hypothetical protein